MQREKRPFAEMRVAGAKKTDWAAVAMALVMAVMAYWDSVLSGPRKLALAVAISFALAAWLLKGVEVTGTLAGAGIAFVFFRAGGWSMFLLLLSVFVITLIATLISARKRRSGNAGRSASQVGANLFVATVIALRPSFWGVLIVAALAELAADTVSSEVGESLGQDTFLLPRFQKVAAGTNGGVSFAGTAAGVAAATIIVFVAWLVGIRGELWIAEAAAIAGMFFDSFLGAGFENRGWLNNDAVNLFGTGSAVAVAWALMRVGA
jgi:uncharacterized protein (TIGR00297 family)